MNTMRPSFNQRTAIASEHLLAIVQSIIHLPKFNPLRVAITFAYFGYMRISNLTPTPQPGRLGPLPPHVKRRRHHRTSGCGSVPKMDKNPPSQPQSGSCPTPQLGKFSSLPSPRLGRLHTSESWPTRPAPGPPFSLPSLRRYYYHHSPPSLISQGPQTGTLDKIRLHPT